MSDYTSKFIEGSTEGAAEYQARIAPLVSQAAKAAEEIGKARISAAIRS